MDCWRLKLQLIDGYRCLVADVHNKSKGKILKIRKKDWHVFVSLGVPVLKPASYNIFKPILWGVKA